MVEQGSDLTVHTEVGSRTPGTEIGSGPTVHGVVAALAEEGIVAGSAADVVPDELPGQLAPGASPPAAMIAE